MTEGKPMYTDTLPEDDQKRVLGLLDSMESIEKLNEGAALKIRVSPLRRVPIDFGQLEHMDGEPLNCKGNTHYVTSGRVASSSQTDTTSRSYLHIFGDGRVEAGVLLECSYGLPVGDDPSSIDSLLTKAVERTSRILLTAGEARPSDKLVIRASLISVKGLSIILRGKSKEPITLKPITLDEIMLPDLVVTTVQRNELNDRATIRRITSELSPALDTIWRATGSVRPRPDKS